jgi:2-iminobutanoate/2-iminopropanoate deaminase
MSEYIDASGVPTDIVGQSEQAWENVLRVLATAAMTVDDIVKVTQYLTRAEDVKAYAQVRNRFLGAARPASMLLSFLNWYGRVCSWKWK